jgi:putative phosphoesterase
MLIAALGDIHGNLPALEAALGAIDDAGIHTILNTGDSIVGRPWPNEVVEILRERDIPSVQGELDRYAVVFHRKRATFKNKDVTPEVFQQIEETHEITRSENLEYLRGLPRSLTLSVDGISIALCHGTLTSQSESLQADDPDSKFSRQRETNPVRIIVSGRTHAPFSRMVGDTFFVNPGSIGIPKGRAATASYAIINTEEEVWTAEFLTVPYKKNR